MTKKKGKGLFSREKVYAKDATDAEGSAKVSLPVESAAPAVPYREAVKQRVSTDKVDWENTYVVIFSHTFIEARELVARLSLRHDRWVWLRGADVLLAYENHKTKRIIVWRCGEYYKRQNLIDIERIIEARGLVYEDAPA